MTQKTILDAKRDGREIKDGEFSNSLFCSLYNWSNVIWRYQ